LESPLVWAEIDLQAIAHNVRELRRITRAGTKLLVAVKANGYGHGAVEVAKTALQNGADALGAARIEEGILLRSAGIVAPILILGYTDPALAEKLIASDLTQTIWSLETAEQLSRTAVQVGKEIRIHLKVDTGMGRLGLLPDISRQDPSNMMVADDAIAEVTAIDRLPGLELEGVYTHFPTADSADKMDAEAQLDRFQNFTNLLRHAGIEVPLQHAANSAAIIDMPETHLDMVRAGISVYGLYPSRQVAQDRVVLQPAMALKTRIIQLKRVPEGFKVSYGSTFSTEKPTWIATVPIGYADGLSRRLSSRGHMLVAGHRVPIAGRVCMDLTMLDVGDIPDIAVGNEVVVFGRQEDAAIAVDEVASMLDTINYEIVSNISERVPRIYLR
jgi:alanine racemase